jgi:hypothetical protein
MICMQYLLILLKVRELTHIKREISTKEKLQEDFDFFIQLYSTWTD